jgi:hypothetical protein
MRGVSDHGRKRPNGAKIVELRKKKGLAAGAGISGPGGGLPVGVARSVANDPAGRWVYGFPHSPTLRAA